MIVTEPTPVSDLRVTWVITVDGAGVKRRWRLPELVRTHPELFVSN